MRTLPAAVCLALFLLAPSRSALSEPLVVLGSPGSFLIFDYEGDFFRFAGNDFAIGVNNGSFFPRVPVASCSTCRPGDVLDMSFATPGEVSLGPGNAMFGTAVYTGITLWGSLNFSVPAMFVPGGNPEDQVRFPSAPFAFTGTVRGVSDGTELFAVSLVGNGRVRQPFVPKTDGTWEWEEGRRDYWFADSPSPSPVPEPATLLMLCGGVAGALGARHRRRGQRQAGSARSRSDSR